MSSLSAFFTVAATCPRARAPEFGVFLLSHGFLKHDRLLQVCSSDKFRKIQKGVRRARSVWRTPFFGFFRMFLDFRLLQLCFRSRVRCFFG